jgi:hypothetical protein
VTYNQLWSEGGEESNRISDADKFKDFLLSADIRAVKFPHFTRAAKDYVEIPSGKAGIFDRPG